MPRSEPSLDGQRFFVTWSQAAEVSIDELADFISSLPDFLWLEIIQEAHQQDGVHYHAVIVFARRFRGSMRAFDFGGLHPNIRAIRNATVDLDNRRHYLRKGNRSKEDEHTIASHKKSDCDYCAEPEQRGAVPEYTVSAGRLDWGGIIQEATTEAEFLALCKKHQPKQWVLQNDQCCKYAAKYFAPQREPEKVYAPESFVVPAELDAWCREVFAQVSTVILFGIARLRGQPCLI